MTRKHCSTNNSSVPNKVKLHVYKKYSNTSRLFFEILFLSSCCYCHLIHLNLATKSTFSFYYKYEWKVAENNWTKIKNPPLFVSHGNEIKFEENFNQFEMKTPQNVLLFAENRNKYNIYAQSIALFWNISSQQYFFRFFGIFFHTWNLVLVTTVNFKVCRYFVK